MSALEELQAFVAEIADLQAAAGLLGWDERTQMPPRGAEVRSEQLATLARLSHSRLASDELGRLLENAESGLGDAPRESFEASLLRVTRRDWEKARRVPVELRGEIARVTSIAEHAWARARTAADFSAFLPHLEHVVELERRYLECFEFEHPYDPLLDDFEPGMRTETLRPVLEALRDGIRPLAASIANAGTELDDSILRGRFDPAVQESIARELAGLLPLEEDAWRLDSTVHPFAAPIGISDLRITTRFESDYLGTSLWAVIHEVGHALYHNGIDHSLERTPLCRSSSLGFDESQSRLWENWVGRGLPFMTVLAGLLARHLPEQFGSLDEQSLYRAANAVAPSLIRVDADEVTYNLHIVLRFELELELYEESLAPRDLPEAWREKTRELLGLEVPDDASGVLQDVHWGAGAFGYFPTYSLGNVIAAQLWDAARAALPELDSQLAAGELAPLRDFMAERVYREGGKFEPAEMIQRAVGGPLDPAPLLRQLNEKYGALYGL
jgi:carboxypeptidase Taq